METMMKEMCSAKEDTLPEKTKPRALILKATNKDFDKITKLIKSELPEVEILYLTTGPPASILRVTKSLPFEMQNSPEQPL